MIVLFSLFILLFYSYITILFYMEIIKEINTAHTLNEYVVQLKEKSLSIAIHLITKGKEIASKQFSIMF